MSLPAGDAVGLTRILTVGQYGTVNTGGAERYRYETVMRLRSRGLLVAELYADGGGMTSRLSLPWQVFSGGYHPAWPRQLDLILREQRPDVIYAHLTVPGLVEVVTWRAALLHIPVCLVYHSDMTGRDLLRRLLGEIWHRSIGRAVLRRLAVLVVSSPEYQRASPWLSTINGRSIHYAPPGVDALMAQGRRHRCRPYILFVGKSKSESKGFNVLYQAWRRMRRCYAPDVGLTVVGSVPDSAYPGVHFLGQIEERERLADCYASALGTVLPSLTTSESFGMVLAEALVAGCPVIGSQIGGIPAIITPGENGYLVTPGDVNALCEAMIRMYRYQGVLRGSILSSRALLLKRFSWELTTDRVLEALREAALMYPRV